MRQDLWVASATKDKFFSLYDIYFQLHEFFMRILITLILTGAWTLSGQAQKKDAYVIYNDKGRKVTYRKMLKKVSKSDITLFGEYHNNPICHWLELALAKDLKAKTKNLILGAEMIEADNQDPLDAYMEDRIDYSGLDSLARLWSNYRTDYAPLVDFAKANNLKFIGTNIPRRYASMVFKQGGFAALEGLPKEELDWIVPLPIPFDPMLSQYKEMQSMMEGHDGIPFVQAQAIKDATMAHFILEHYIDESIFLHYNGTFHSDYYQGILWYLQQAQPYLQYVTISTVEQDDVYSLDTEHEGKADFIICIDADMTKTY